MPFSTPLRTASTFLLVGLLSFLFASVSVAIAQPLTSAVQAASAVNWSAIQAVTSGLIGTGAFALSVATIVGRKQEKRKADERQTMNETIGRIDRRTAMLQRNLVRVNHNVTRSHVWAKSGLQTVGARVVTIERDHKRNGCYEDDGRDIGPFDFGDPGFENLEEETNP